MAKYRFDEFNNSLSKYDEGQNAYIHVWRHAKDDTEAKAIAAYERSEAEEEGDLGVFGNFVADNADFL